MSDNKILIVTLGKGSVTDLGTKKAADIRSITPAEIISKLEKGEYNYRLAKYSYEDSAPIDSPFVASVLIEKYSPDKLAIVGTGSSMWGEFYHKMCLLYNAEECLSDEQRLNMGRILEYELNYNRNVCDDKLIEEEQYLNNVFTELADHPGLKIKVILTKYGIDQGELSYNYEQFKQLESLFVDEAGTVNKVAFDITHSFRSLPIYNLAVLNYIKSLSDYRIEIEKVFYGNLDISGENNNIAPIVDLSMLVRVIDLANGIVEFKNTGNAVTICKGINSSREKDGFIDLVQKFDWATQTNNRKEIRQNLQGILEYSFSESEKKESIVYDAEYAIQTILKTAFGSVSDDVAKQQINLAVWSLKQGRVGLAAAIAKEALRSFLVKRYAVIENRTIDEENENERKRAEQLFRNRCNQVNQDHVFSSFTESERKAVIIRNIYAHNLLKNDVDSEITGYESAYTIINEYIKLIIQIMDCPEDDFRLSEILRATHSPKKEYLVISMKSGDSLKEFAQKSIGTNTSVADVDIWVIDPGSIDLDIKSVDRNHRKDRRIMVARIIAGRISEEFNDSKLDSIFFDKEIDNSLIVNTSMLIKQSIPNNVSFYIMNDDGRKENVITLYWDIDFAQFTDEIETDKAYMDMRFKLINEM